MHLEVLAGRIGLDDARRERFRRVFRALGVALDDATSTRRLGVSLGYMARRALDGAADLLTRCARHARIAIVTNNLLEEQQDKLESCGLAPLVDALSRRKTSAYRNRIRRSSASRCNARAWRHRTR